MATYASDTLIRVQEDRLRRLLDDHNTLKRVKKQLEIFMPIAGNEDPPNYKLNMLIGMLESILKSKDHPTTLMRVNTTEQVNTLRNKYKRKYNALLNGSENEIPDTKTKKGKIDIKEEPEDNDDEKYTADDNENYTTDDNENYTADDDEHEEEEGQAICTEEGCGKGGKYKAGDLVFAQFEEYPPWPARVKKRAAEKRETYIVDFYGTHEVAAVIPKYMYPVNEETFKIFHPARPTRAMKGALDELLRDPDTAKITGLQLKRPIKRRVEASCPR